MCAVHARTLNPTGSPRVSVAPPARMRDDSRRGDRPAGLHPFNVIERVRSAPFPRLWRLIPAPLVAFVEATGSSAAVCQPTSWASSGGTCWTALVSGTLAFSVVRLRPKRELMMSVSGFAGGAEGIGQRDPRPPMGERWRQCDRGGHRHCPRGRVRVIRAWPAQFAAINGEGTRVARQSRDGRPVGSCPGAGGEGSGGGRLPDVGKLRVAAQILSSISLTRSPMPSSRPSSARLTRDAEMIACLGDSELAAIVRHHHERLDGNGYPSSLLDEQISVRSADRRCRRYVRRDHVSPPVAAGAVVPSS